MVSLVGLGTATITVTVDTNDLISASKTVVVTSQNLHGAATWRSDEFRNRILGLISGKNNWNDVTPSDLDGITTDSLLDTITINSLDRYDLSGLTGLTRISFWSDRITTATIPTGSLEDLSSVELLSFNASDIE